MKVEILISVLNATARSKNIPYKREGVRTNSRKTQYEKKPARPMKTKPEARNSGDRKVGIEEHIHLLKRLTDDSKEERKSKSA